MDFIVQGYIHMKSEYEGSYGRYDLMLVNPEG